MNGWQPHCATNDFFYLIVDRQRNSDNVYLLNAVTLDDLIALAEKNDKNTNAGGNSGTSAIPTGVQPNTTEGTNTNPPASTESKPEISEKKGNNNTIIFIIIAVVIFGGAVYYFKIVRGKKNSVVTDDDEDDDYDYKDEPDESDNYDDYTDNTSEDGGNEE